MHHSIHIQTGQVVKPQQRGGPKPTRVADLERRLEDLTSRLDSVSRQHSTQLSVSPIEPTGPGHHTAQLDVFHLKDQWSYMYPTVMPTKDLSDATTVQTVNEPNGAYHFGRQTSFTQQNGVCSPPVTNPSPASINNTVNNSSSSSSSRSSNSTAPTSGAEMDTDDLRPCSLLSSLQVPGGRPYLSEVSMAAGSKKRTPGSKKPLRLTGSFAAPLSSPVPDNIWPKPDEAEIMLSEYRDYMMPLFPFVIIQQYTTAEQLRCDQPTLWKAVMIAACHLDFRRQIVMGNQLVGELAAAAFLQPRRSLDTLQAVLILIGWFHYNINSFQLVNFSYMARSMCVSLGISEPFSPVAMQKKIGEEEAEGQDQPQKQQHHSQGLGSVYGNGEDAKHEDDGIGICTPISSAGGSISMIVSNGLSKQDCGLRQTKEYSAEALEQMRTLAGTFYVVSVLSTTNKRPDAMLNSAYLETCCQVLERNMEYQSDAYLLQLVRIQQLSQSISVAYSLRTDGMQMGVHSRHLYQDLRQQLEAFKAQLPEQYNRDVNLNGHVYTAETLLYEAVLQESGHAAWQNDPMSNDELLEILWSCTRSINAYMLKRFQDCVSDRPRFLCLTSYDFIYTFLTALKLITIQVPGWDCRRARRELAFDDVIDRQILDLQCLAERRNQNRARHTPKDTSTAHARDNSNNGSADPYKVEGRSPDDNASAAGSTTGVGASTSGEQPGKGSPLDPFTRLADRLTYLKAMISTELDKMPPHGSNNSSSSSGSSFSTYMHRTAAASLGLGSSPFVTMDAAIGRPTSVVHQPTMHIPATPVPSTSTVPSNPPNPSAHPVTAPPHSSTCNMPAVMHAVTAHPHTHHHSHSHSHYPHLHSHHQSPVSIHAPHPYSVAASLGGMPVVSPAMMSMASVAGQGMHPTPVMGSTMASANMPFGGTIPVSAEPVLTFADATMDYMQTVEGHGLVGLYNVPAWESFMDPNLGTPPYYDSLAQANTA
ncbi:trna processing endoribonuclease [Ophiostoma piceae UAMH 11346]|uniref:Trna processing endoribonuclease n=1 Tax=Ophiostoma piceae (strain UAMH 11346) TaxID=1262450 RepID=S3CLB5_OPHP1|nr:trna processing endoribonuclease [Ophiostoma piceae UAMH 11346]